MRFGRLPSDGVVSRDTMQPLSKTLSYTCFLAVLIFAPLAFGTVETWSYAVMEIMIGLCALFYVVSRRDAPFHRPPGLTPMLLIAAFLLLQVLPLPGVLVRLLSPETYRLYHFTTGAFDGGGWMTLSVHPRATLLELARFSSYMVFFFVAVQLLTDYILLKRTLVVITAFAAILSFLVIIQFITRRMGEPFNQDTIFWIRSSIHGAGSIGPYVNRNHYAGLMEMIFPLTVALFLVKRSGSSTGDLKEKLRNFFVHHRISAHLFYGAASILIGVSVFVSLSRGGIFSLTVAMAVLSVWLARKTANVKAGLVAAALFVCILVMTGAHAWDRIFERFSELRVDSGEIHTSRFTYWQDGTGIIKDFPLAGTGVGTWRDVYPLYRTLPRNAVLEHAHSDYVEFSATGGIVLMGLMAFTLYRVTTSSYRSYRRRRKRIAIYLFVASLAAVLSILLHAVVEFNMQVGANGLYFMFVLALMISAAHTRFFNGARPSYLPRVAVGRRVSIVTAAVFLGMVFLIQGGVLKANYHYFDYRDVSLTGDNAKDLRMASRKAAAADPWNASYHHAAAAAAVMLGDPDVARRHYRRAVELNPLNVRILQDAGTFFFRRNEPDIGDRLMQAGIRYSYGDIDVYLHHASALFETGRPDDGLKVLKTAMEAFPEHADVCLALMVWVGVAESRMRQAFPERIYPFLAFGDYLASLGKYQGAGEAYLEALSHASREETVRKRHFLHVYRFFMARKDLVRARVVIDQALEFFPDDSQLNNILARL